MDLVHNVALASYAVECGSVRSLVARTPSTGKAAMGAGNRRHRVANGVFLSREGEELGGGVDPMAMVHARL